MCGLHFHFGSSVGGHPGCFQWAAVNMEEQVCPRRLLVSLAVQSLLSFVRSHLSVTCLNSRTSRPLPREKPFLIILVSHGCSNKLPQVRLLLKSRKSFSHSNRGQNIRRRYSSAESGRPGGRISMRSWRRHVQHRGSDLSTLLNL